jgi:S1-C subfamily serine protease
VLDGVMLDEWRVGRLVGTVDQVREQAEEWEALGVETLTPSAARELGLPERHAVVVRSVGDSSPAADAGVRPGDVILEVDHQRVVSVAEMKRVLDRHPKNTPVVVLLRRQDQSLYVAMDSRG